MIDIVIVIKKNYVINQKKIGVGGVGDMMAIVSKKKPSNVQRMTIAMSVKTAYQAEAQPIGDALGGCVLSMMVS